MYTHRTIYFKKIISIFYLLEATAVFFFFFKKEEKIYIVNSFFLKRKRKKLLLLLINFPLTTVNSVHDFPSGATFSNNTFILNVSSLD